MQGPRQSLTKFAWLSIGAAVTTIAIKLTAYLLTDSVGLLSDALEGFVNLAAAVVVFVALKVVQKPPDDQHEYGHDKAEYFSSGIEAAMIIIASLSILYTSVRRLLDPHPLEQLGLGLGLALSASLINLVVGQILIRAGKTHESITLETDGRHLMTDVWTSVGVVAGLIIAAVSGLAWLDPVIAMIVGAKIGLDGLLIFRKSSYGLMDSAVDPQERAVVEEILNSQAANGVSWHALRSRQSGAVRFFDVHLLFPGNWPVQRAHDKAEKIEEEIREQVNNSTVITHLEPIEDPKSFDDGW